MTVLTDLSSKLRFEPSKPKTNITFSRAVASSENPGGGLVVLGEDNVSFMVDIGLTDLTKTGGLKLSQPPRLRQLVKNRSFLGLKTQ